MGWKIYNDTWLNTKARPVSDVTDMDLRSTDTEVGSIASLQVEVCNLRAFSGALLQLLIDKAHVTPDEVRELLSLGPSWRFMR